MTHNIMVCSRKINFWSFKTQEEIKTSHEFEVSFAKYNRHFDAVVSGDEGGFIAVWDVENGKLMSKFVAQSSGNPKLTDSTKSLKVTTGTFDNTGRRLITSGADGTVKVWNFSNGSILNELLSADRKEKVDSEITSLISIWDPDKKKVKTAQFLAVGWDKKLHIWDDPADEENKDGEDEQNWCHDWPSKTSPPVHKHDIMSCIFYLRLALVFTGSVDGTLVAWNLDTGFARYYLHERDASMMCKRDTEGMEGNTFVEESKSIDALIIMEQHDILVSMSGDQTIRFWDLMDLQTVKGPLFKMSAGHGDTKEDQLTGIAITTDNKNFVTTDTSGRIKMFDCSRITDWRKEKDHASKIRTMYFINAHRALISSVECVEKRSEEEEANDESSDEGDFEGIPKEPYQPWPDKFILTSSQDSNILLHRLSNGVLVGQFGQEAYWNIYDLTPYQGVMPNYERNWFKQQKDNWRGKMTEVISKAKDQGLIKEEDMVEVRGSSTRDKLRSLGLLASEKTKDDSFDATLDDLDCGPIDDDAFQTSDEEEFDSLKGKNLFDDIAKPRRSDGQLEDWRKAIIEGDKRYKMALLTKNTPDEDFMKARADQRVKIMEKVDKIYPLRNL